MTSASGVRRLERRRLDDPVAQRDRAELGRAEHIWRAVHAAADHVGSVHVNERSGQIWRRGRDHPGRQGHPRRDLRRPHRTGGGADRGGPHPGTGHRAGRRRPRLAGLRARQALRLRQGRHHLDPPRPARRRQPGRRSTTTIDELNANPDCTGYIVQLPLPRTSTRTPRWSASTRTRTPTACIRPTWAGWCSTKPAPLPCTPRGIVHLLRRYDVPIAGAHVVVIGRGVTVGRPLGPAADPALRERHSHVVPHRNS